MRAMSVEIAMIWLRFQPKTALSPWYRRRFAGAGLRMPRAGIVALAAYRNENEPCFVSDGCRRRQSAIGAHALVP